MLSCIYTIGVRRYSTLYGSINTVDGGMFVFIHRNDKALFSVYDLGMNLSDLFRFYAQNDVVGFDGGNTVFAFFFADGNRSRFFQLLF